MKVNGLTPKAKQYLKPIWNHIRTYFSLIKDGRCSGRIFVIFGVLVSQQVEAHYRESSEYVCPLPYELHVFSLARKLITGSDQTLFLRGGYQACFIVFCRSNHIRWFITSVILFFLDR